ncbi:hypothetical protein IscW_ISCW004014, partial [Ixodes scapularis]
FKKENLSLLTHGAVKELNRGVPRGVNHSMYRRTPDEGGSLGFLGRGKKGIWDCGRPHTGDDDGSWCTPGAAASNSPAKLLGEPIGAQATQESRPLMGLNKVIGEQRLSSPLYFSHYAFFFPRVLNFRSDSGVCDSEPTHTHLCSISYARR